MVWHFFILFSNSGYNNPLLKFDLIHFILIKYINFLCFDFFSIPFNLFKITINQFSYKDTYLHAFEKTLRSTNESSGNFSLISTSYMTTKIFTENRVQCLELHTLKIHF